jgi:DNA-binding CsgD family transcriptional regulator
MEFDHALKVITSFVFISLVIVSVLLIYFYYYKNNFFQEKKKSEVLQGALENIKLIKQTKEEELAKVKRKFSKLNKVPDKQINLLKSTVIITNEDWEQYKKKYNNVYKDYIFRLRKEVQNITPAEERLVMLANLQLNYNEIASLLGTSTGSVRITWYRLRKKINTNSETALIQFANSI